MNGSISIFWKIFTWTRYVLLLHFSCNNTILSRDFIWTGFCAKNIHRERYVILSEKISIQHSYSIFYFILLTCTFWWIDLILQMYRTWWLLYLFCLLHDLIYFFSFSLRELIFKQRLICKHGFYFYRWKNFVPFLLTEAYFCDGKGIEKKFFDRNLIRNCPSHVREKYANRMKKRRQTVGECHWRPTFVKMVCQQFFWLVE